MKHPILSMLALLLAASPPLGPPAAGQFDGGPTTPRLAPEIVWRGGRPVAGTTSTLGIVLDIQTGWHVQAGAGSGDEQPPYVATAIDLDLPEGWTAGPIAWPEAHAVVLGSGVYTERLLCYEGRVLAAIPVDVPPDAGGTSGRIRAAVSYQACDDETCEMPTSIEVATVARVVEPGATTDAAPIDDTIARLFEQTLRRDADIPIGAGPTDENEASWLEFDRVRWWIALAFVLAAITWMALRTRRSPSPHSRTPRR